MLNLPAILYMNNAIKRSILLFFAGILCIQATAQTDGDSLLAKPTKLDGFNAFYMHPLNSYYEGSMLMATGDLLYSSGPAVNNLAYSFYLQKPISQKAVNSTVDKLSAINVGGRETNIGLKYLFAPKNMYGNFFFAQYSYRRHQSVKFTDDFGKFFFKGNKEYAGREMILDDLQYLSTKYDALQLGWLRYFTIKKHRANLSVSAGLARGFDYRHYSVGRARLFTEQSGEYIDVQLDMEAQQAYTTRYNVFNTKPSGWGAIADIDFNVALTEKTGLGIQIHDLGFMSWIKNPAVYSRNDTTIRFDGVFVASVDSLNNPAYVDKIGDSIVTTFKIPYSRKPFNSVLPTNIALTYYLKFTEKNYVNLSFRTIAFSSYRPQLSIQSINFIGKRVYSSTTLAIGGFGPFDLCQTVGYQFNKRYFASLGLFGIEGMLLPAHTAGFGGNINFSVKL